MTLPTAPTGTRLKDKVILVTGSGTGIGEGMARRFVSEGALVMLHDRESEALAALASELGKNSAWVIGDLEDPKVPARLIEETLAHFGRIDALVNNAAVKTRGGIEDTDEEAFDRTVSVNLKAPFFLIRAALPHFRKQGGGRILNIGSINAYCGEKNQCIYSACKGALMTLTRNLADAHGAEGIRVNQINPGWTLTPNERALKATEGLPEDWPSRLPAAYAPGGRLFSPDDVACAALYFLSDEAALVNGAVLDLEQYPMIGRNPPKEIPS
jgi:NAD(P)-dependent dehydrogenase (short-subunit alcohol dehydrogenase family)